MSGRTVARRPAERVRGGILRYHTLTCERCQCEFQALVTRFPKKCQDCRPRKYRRGV